jgi:hypothetical protein
MWGRTAVFRRLAIVTACGLQSVLERRCCAAWVGDLIKRKSVPLPLLGTLVVSTVIAASPADGALVPSATALDATCFGRSATVTGTQGDDELRGTLGPDVIVGRGGNDVIVGRDGNDLVCAAMGRDRIEGGPGADRLVAGTDSDLVLGGLGADRLAGGDADDRLMGGSGDDRLAGGSGWDALDGGAGANRIRGGSGADNCINPDGGGALGCETRLAFSTADRQFDNGVDNQGAWSNQRPAFSGNYIAARNFNGTFRNFFTFHLDNLRGNVVAARLVVRRAAGCGRPMYGLFHVTTDAETLNNTMGRNPGIFADLGSGTSYGTFQPRPLTCAEGGGPGVYRFDLNSAAVSDISLAAGGVFSLGGAVLRPTTGMLFGDSFRSTRLVVGIAPEV